MAFPAMGSPPESAAKAAEQVISAAKTTARPIMRAIPSVNLLVDPTQSAGLYLVRSQRSIESAIIHAARGRVFALNQRKTPIHRRSVDPPPPSGCFALEVAAEREVTRHAFRDAHAYMLISIPT